MVFDVPTSVTAVSFIGVAVPIALIVSAMRFVTAVVSVRADHTGRQSKEHLRSRRSQPHD